VEGTNQIKIKKLRDKLRETQLNATGKKAELRERLRRHMWKEVEGSEDQSELENTR
jgi:hypothetical protein